jgi:hypothetical protein
MYIYTVKKKKKKKNNNKNKFFVRKKKTTGFGNKLYHHEVITYRRSILFLSHPSIFLEILFLFPILVKKLIEIHFSIIIF